MGRNMHALVEVKLPGEEHWRLFRTWPFTDRHNGVYDDLDAENTFVMLGSPIDRATLRALDVEPEKWVTRKNTGVRMVSSEAFCRVVEKWESDPRGLGYTVGVEVGRHAEIQHIRDLLAAGAFRGTDQDDAAIPELRVIYEYDGCPFTDTVPYVYAGDQSDREQGESATPIPFILRCIMPTVKEESDDGE